VNYVIRTLTTSYPGIRWRNIKIYHANFLNQPAHRLVVSSRFRACAADRMQNPNSIACPRQYIFNVPSVQSDKNTDLWAGGENENGLRGDGTEKGLKSICNFLFYFFLRTSILLEFSKLWIYFGIEIIVYFNP